MPRAPEGSPALLCAPESLLTGSRPSMASIQSRRSSSESACMVMTPGLREKGDAVSEHGTAAGVAQMNLS